MPYDAAPALLVLLAVLAFVVSILNGTIGFGFGILSINLLAVAFGPKVGVLVLSIVGLPLASAQVIHRRRHAAIARRLRSLVATAMIGVFVGVPILVLLPVWALAIILGLFTGWYALESLRAQRAPLSPGVEHAVAPVVGMTAGTTAGAIGATGPLLGTYLTAIGLRGSEFAFAINLVFVSMGIVRAILLVTVGQYTPDALGLAALLLGPALAGQMLGFRVQGRLPAVMLHRAVLVVLAIAALNLVASGVETGAAALR